MTRPGIATGLLLLLALGPMAHGEDGADAAFRQWQATYVAAQSRVGNTGTLREALNEVGKSENRMRGLADSCRDHASDLASRAFKLKMIKGEWESAQKEATRKSDIRDAKYQQLMDGVTAWKTPEKARLAAELERLNQWGERLTQRHAELDVWWTRIAPLMRTYTIPDEQAGLDQAWAEKHAYDAGYKAYSDEYAQYKAASVTYDSQLAEAEAELQTRLQQVLAFVQEEGRQSLEAQAIASKKEREFHEAEAKSQSIKEKLAAESAELTDLLSSADGILQVVIKALDAPASAQPASYTPAEPYTVRTNDETARAKAPPGADTASPSSPLRSGILVLPPIVPATSKGEAIRHQIETQAAVDALASQYREVAAAVDSAAPADSTALVRAPTGSVGPAPVSYAGPGDDGSAVIVLTDDMLYRLFDPRIFISDGEYQQALATQARYRELAPKLQALLTKMHKERDKTAGYSAEFENMRAEIVRGSVRDLLSVYATAGGPMLDQLALDPRYAKTLTPDVINRIKLAFTTLRMEVGRQHAKLATDPLEQRKQQLEVMDAGAEALLAVCTGELAKEATSRQALEQMGNLLKVYTKTSRYLIDPEKNKRPDWQQAGEIVKLGVDLTAVYCPPVSLGVGVESLGERGMQWAITQDAVESLSASLVSTDDAIVYLSGRLTRTQAILDASQQTIKNYQAVDPTRRQAFHIEVPMPPASPITPAGESKRPGDVEFDGRRGQ